MRPDAGRRMEIAPNTANATHTCVSCERERERERVVLVKGKVPPCREKGRKNPFCKENQNPKEHAHLHMVDGAVGGCSVRSLSSAFAQLRNSHTHTHTCRLRESPAPNWNDTRLRLSKLSLSLLGHVPAALRDTGTGGKKGQSSPDLSVPDRPTNRLPPLVDATHLQSLESCRPVHRNPGSGTERRL